MAQSDALVVSTTGASLEKYLQWIDDETSLSLS